MDVVPVFVGAGGGDLRTGLHLHLAAGLLPGKFIAVLTAGLGNQAQSALDTGDGHRVQPAVSGSQGVHLLLIHGTDTQAHRLAGCRDGKCLGNDVRPYTAAPQHRGAVLHARAHVHHGNGQGVVLPVHPGIVILGIGHRGTEVVHVAQIDIDVLLQNRREGHVAGGAGRQAVAPADNAGKILRRRLHVRVIALLNHVQILLTHLAELLPLAGALGFQQLILGSDLLFHQQHGHKQCPRHDHQNNKNHNIAYPGFLGFVFPHSF